MVKATQPARPGPAQIRLGIRGWLLTAPRGWLLGLDQCRGVVRAIITDHEVPGVHMRRGVAVVEVWGGKRSQVALLLENQEGPGLSLVLVWREPTALMRTQAWLAWRWWQARHARPWGWLPGRLYRALPTMVKSSPPIGVRMPTKAKAGRKGSRA